MQKGMPNYYEYNGHKYSLWFPVEWAVTHIEGTGPQYCNLCKNFGCDNEIFKKYCDKCSEHYSDNPRNTGEVCRSSSFVYNDDDDISSIISNDNDEGIGCNRCYSCVTGGAGRCVLTGLDTDCEDVDIISNETSNDNDNDNDNDTIISDVSYDVDDVSYIVDHDELDNITIINHTCNHYDLSTNVTLDLQSNDGSVYDMDIDVGIGTDSVHAISQSAVKPLFDVDTYNAEEDVFAEINRYIEENPPIYDEEHGFGVEFGSHQYNGGYDTGVDAVVGYNSY
jgi:hypothetical protein